MIDVFLLLGSNLGYRRNYLEKAIEAINKSIAPVIKKSSVYETQAWGREDDPDYLNQVIVLQTDLPAAVILEKLLLIEQSLGRERKEQWASRTIDIDMLFYGSSLINTPKLIVPHPRLHLRRFTLEPLAEIAPEFIHPVFNKRIEALKNELHDDLVVKKL